MTISSRKGDEKKAVPNRKSKKEHYKDYEQTLN